MALKRAKTKKAPAPITYLQTVMFDASDVQGKDAAKDNMEWIGPKCVHAVEDGDVVAVYQFVGLKKVSKAVTFEDTK